MENAAIKGFPNNVIAWQTRSPLYLLALKRKHYNINWVFLKKPAASGSASTYCPMSLPLAHKSILGLWNKLWAEKLSVRYQAKNLTLINSAGVVLYENALSIQSISLLPLFFSEEEKKKKYFLTGIFFRNCTWSKREPHSYQKGLCVLTEEAIQSLSAATTHLMTYT